MKNYDTLLVYYSRTGVTRKIAELVSDYIPCDIEEISEKQERTGIIGIAKSIFESLLDVAPDIQVPEKNPADYRLVIVGTPVWMGKIASPVRTYLLRKGESFREVAFFSTSESSTAKAVFEQMEEICGIAPMAELAISKKEMSGTPHVKRVGAFATKILHLLEKRIPFPRQKESEKTAS